MGCGSKGDDDCRSGMRGSVGRMAADNRGEVLSLTFLETSQTEADKL